jgi:hypothetical protein
MLLSLLCNSITDFVVVLKDDFPPKDGRSSILEFKISFVNGCKQLVTRHVEIHGQFKTAHSFFPKGLLRFYHFLLNTQHFLTFQHILLFSLGILKLNFVIALFTYIRCQRQCNIRVYHITANISLNVSCSNTITKTYKLVQLLSEASHVPHH